MMQIIMTLSEKCNLSPFDILNQDFDDFALLVNYFIDNQEDQTERVEVKSKPTSKGNDKRVRVNDKTASGGWF